MLQSEEYFHIFPEILKVTLSAEQALCMCITDGVVMKGRESGHLRKAAVDLQSQGPNNRLLKTEKNISLISSIIYYFKVM